MTSGSPIKAISLPLERLCRNAGFGNFVILNEVKNLIISTESIIEILRLAPQNDITTQPPRGRISLVFLYVTEQFFIKVLAIPDIFGSSPN